MSVPHVFRASAQSASAPLKCEAMADNTERGNCEAERKQLADEIKELEQELEDALLSSTRKAYRIAQRLESLNETLFGSESLQCAAALAARANVSSVQNDLFSAEETYKAALDVAKKVAPASKETASILAELARIVATQDRFEEAEPLFRKALELRVQLFGSQHPLVGRTYLEFGKANLQAHLVDDAYHNLSRAPAILAQSLADNDPDRVSIILLVAETARELDRRGEAIEFRRRAADIANFPADIQRSDVLLKLAQLLLIEGDMNGAKQVLDREGKELGSAINGAREKSSLLRSIAFAV
jgi:tetratricopeptide (TPR) repeat protein